MITGKILTGITSVFLLSAFMTTPTLADTSINISGNGSRSDNTVEVDRTRTFNLSQNNDTSITNSVSIQNNTGHNEASGNTKGDVRIHTGDAHADVNIVNRAGVNVAHVNGCCEGDNLNIDIRKNGSRSDNSVNYSDTSHVSIDQQNRTDIVNDVAVSNNTGHNKANDNTWGDVSVRTGDAHATVSVNNEAGKNYASYHEEQDHKVERENKDLREYDYHDHDMKENRDTKEYEKKFSDKYDHKDHEKKHYRDDEKKYDHHEKVKVSYDWDKKDYDHEKKYVDWRDEKQEKKTYISYDWQKKDRDHEMKKYHKDRDHHDRKANYPDVKYIKYHVDRDYGKDHKKDLSRHEQCTNDLKHRDHEKKEQDHKDYYDFSKHHHDKKDHEKHDCYFDKVTYKPVVIYVPAKVYYHADYKKDGDYDKKKHVSHHTWKKDHDDKKDMKKVRDHAKKYDQGKKYARVTYAKYEKNRDYDFCDTKDRKDYVKNTSIKWNPYHKKSNGAVYIRTGNVRSNVNVHNSGSSNYLSFI